MNVDLIKPSLVVNMIKYRIGNTTTTTVQRTLKSILYVQ